MSYTNISGKRSHRFPLMGDCGCGCGGSGGCGDDGAEQPTPPQNDKMKKAVIYGGGALLFLWVLGRSDPRKMPS